MKKTLICILAATAGFTAGAQKNFGEATGNWSGLGSLYLNPANIADSREKFCIELFSVNAGVDNNLGQINTNGIGKFINGNNTSLNDVFSYGSNSKFSLMAPYAEVRGPGFMATINRRHSIAVTTRVRGFNQFNNFDKSLYRTITDSTYTANGNVDLNAQNFNWTAHLWAEAALTYGAVVLEKGRSELKAGVTVRYLGGIGYLGLKGKNMDIHFNAGQDSLYARNTDIEYASNIVNSGSALANGLSNNNFFSQFFGSKSGSGVGADFGIVYDYLEKDAAERYDMDGKTNIPDPSKNRYKLRLSAAVTDLGAITYNTADNYTVNVTGNGYISGNSFASNLNNFTNFTSYAQKQGFNADTGRAATKVYMPATLLVSADYHAWRNVYVNASYLNNMVNRQNFGNSYYNQFTVTPRYDTRLYSVAVPVTYSALAGNMKMGLAVRVWGFFVGSDDMLLLLSNHQYGVNLYAGASVPFYRRRPKDGDGDHVSNRKDKCPADMGTWENRGCPVKDEDRSKEVRDTTDNCPEARGLELQDTADIDQTTERGEQEPAEEHPANAAARKALTIRAITMPWSRKKSKFDEEETKALNRFAGLMKEYPKGKLQVEGHTGNNDDPAADKAASAHYAEVVKQYLVSQGIAPGRITVVAMGGTKPVNTNNTHAGRAANRRVVIRMVQ